MRMLPALPRFAPAQDLVRDQRGSVGMMYSLSLLGVMLLVGCAVDVGRAAQAKQKLASALDSATIAAAKSMKDGVSSVAQIETMAQTFFDENMALSKGLATITKFKVDVNKAENTVTSTLEGHVPTAFARVAGINKIEVPLTSSATYNKQDIEVGLQLDVTGSMSERIAGKTKLASLKEATNDLVDILLPDSGTGTTKVRLGLAPFSAGVNAGSFAKAVTNGASSACVYERNDSFYDGSDDLASGTAALKAPSNLSSPQPCPSGSKIVPLTDSKTSLKSAVSALNASGTTAGHLGTSWAWYLISPKWASLWPAASKPANYDDANTMKVAVLMTDGLYNTVGGVMSGANVAAAATKARAACKSMRDKNIKIYSVGFIKAGDDPAAADTLKDCAGTNGSFYKAENGDELKAAFKAIAQDISRLRLTK